MCLNYREGFGLSYPYIPDAIKTYYIKDGKHRVDVKNKYILSSLKVNSISDLVCNYYRKIKNWILGKIPKNSCLVLALFWSNQYAWRLEEESGTTKLIKFMYLYTMITFGQLILYSDVRTNIKVEYRPSNCFILLLRRKPWRNCECRYLSTKWSHCFITFLFMKTNYHNWFLIW